MAFASPRKLPPLPPGEDVTPVPLPGGGVIRDILRQNMLVGDKMRNREFRKFYNLGRGDSKMSLSELAVRENTTPEDLVERFKLANQLGMSSDNLTVDLFGGSPSPETKK